MSETGIAAALIAGAILLHGYYFERSSPRYQLSAVGVDGRTVWRMDTSTGKVSVCGSILNGGALSEVRAHQDASISKFAQNPSPEGHAQLAEENKNVEMLAGPRCAGWSFE